jgi:L-rhamnose isomerase
MATKRTWERSFALTEERYAELGVDVSRALKRLASISISLHCWQGDDAGGFEKLGSELGGGRAVTGSNWRRPAISRRASDCVRNSRRRRLGPCGTTMA